ncbi:MAG TPA: hypothetical protein VK988_15510 [Acidimicrobiales bacterium]|nr:hypothetical protein [Acidimicrobiales bacterium]
MSDAGSGLDMGAVVKGAAITIAVTAGPITAARLGMGSQFEEALEKAWVVVVLALFWAFAVGGYAAARMRTTAPYRHAAASAGIAFTAFFVFTVVRRLVTGDGLTVPLVVTMAVLGQVSVSFALLGGYVAWRQSR